MERVEGEEMQAGTETVAKSVLSQCVTWASRRRTVTLKDVEEKFGKAPSVWLWKFLNQVAHMTGMIVIQQRVCGGRDEAGVIRVRKAVHFAWEDEGAEFPGLKDALKELHRMAEHGMKQDSNAHATAMWTRAERIEFFHKLTQITGKLIKG